MRFLQYAAQSSIGRKALKGQAVTVHGELDAVSGAN